jgi:hypothetical protein
MARQIVKGLEEHPHVIANNYTVFLDEKCLAGVSIGEPWQEGFCQGLRGSDLIVLLVSNEGLQSCTWSHERADNYLLEIEQALAMRKAGLAKVVPILLKTSTRFDDTLTQYSEQDAYHPWARRPVRDTLKELFSLQGERFELVRTDQGALAPIVENVLDNLGKSLVSQLTVFFFQTLSFYLV